MLYFGAGPYHIDLSIAFGCKLLIAILIIYIFHNNIVSGPDGFDCDSKLVDTGFETGSGRMFVIEVVQIQ